MSQEMVGLSDQEESLFIAVSEQIVQLPTQLQRLSPSPHSSSTIKSVYSVPSTPSVSSPPPFSASLNISPPLVRPETSSGDSGDCHSFCDPVSITFQSLILPVPSNTPK